MSLIVAVAMGLEMTTLLSVVDSLDALKGLVNLVHRVINQWHCDSFLCFTEIYVPIAVPSIVIKFTDTTLLVALFLTLMIVKIASPSDSNTVNDVGSKPIWTAKEDNTKQLCCGSASYFHFVDYLNN